MISSKLVAHIRTWVGRTLTDTCDVFDTAPSIGAAGEEIASYIPVALNVACRLISGTNSNTAASTIIAARETTTDLYELIVGLADTLNENYVIRHGGVDYEVVRLITDWTDEPFQKAIVTRKR